MDIFLYSQPSVQELNLVFPEYFFKFGAYQNVFQLASVSHLFFQRFAYVSEYSMFQYLNLSERFCIQLKIPELSAQSDYEKLFFSNLSQLNANNDFIVAETIDENAEFIFLIIDQNRNPSVARIFNNRTLEVFRFTTNELWNMTTNSVNYIRNLQLSNSYIQKQWLEMSIFFEFFKQNASSVQIQAVNKEVRLGNLIEGIQEETINKKKEKPIPIKIDLPSLDCLLCYSNPKNIIFLPCAHLIACKSCTTEKLDIVLGKSINQRRTPRGCPLCKQAIKEARQVYLHDE